MDSGANKSGIMIAIADIISGFLKGLLEPDFAMALYEAPANEVDDEDDAGQPVQEDDARATRRRVQMRKGVAATHANKPQI